MESSMYWRLWNEQAKVVDNNHIALESFGNQFVLDVSRPMIRNIFTLYVKLEKFKRRRAPSLHLVKEGDFAQNNSETFIMSSNIQIWAEIFNMATYFLFLVA